MGRQMFACDLCESEYTSPLAAALCCDIAAHGDQD